MGFKLEFSKLIIYGLIIFIPAMFFYVTIISTFQGDLDAFIVLIITWTFLMIMIKFFSNKYFRILKYLSYIHLGMFCFLNFAIILYIISFNPLIGLIYGSISYSILLGRHYKEEILIVLYEIGILKVPFDKIYSISIDKTLNCLIIPTTPPQYLYYFTIPIISVKKVYALLPLLHGQGINLSLEFFSPGRKIPRCYLGIRIKEANKDVALEKLQEQVVQTKLFLESHEISTFKTVRDFNELKGIYFFPLLFFKKDNIKSKISPLKVISMEDRIQDNLAIQSNGSLDFISMYSIKFDPDTPLNLLKIHEKMREIMQEIPPFWFSATLSAWKKEELDFKDKELRSRFQSLSKHLDEELRLDEGKFRLAQVLPSLNKDTSAYNYLFRVDIEKFEQVIKETNEFKYARTNGFWKAAFTIVSSNEMLNNFEKFAPIEFISMKKRALLNVILRDPISNVDLNSNQIRTFLN